MNKYYQLCILLILATTVVTQTPQMVRYEYDVRLMTYYGKSA